MTGPDTERTGRDRPDAALPDSRPRSPIRPDSEPLGRRRFLARAVRAGMLAVFMPSIPRWAAADQDPGRWPGNAGDGRETARAWRAMGTLMEVRIPDLPEADAVEAIRRVRARTEALEAAMTLYRPESPLVALNRSAPDRWFGAPVELVEGVAAALRGARESGGAFDPTVAPMMRAWGLVHLHGRQAPPAVLRAWRRRPGPGAVAVDVGNRRLRRSDPRAEIDLGGVGKGIAVDEALRVLRAAGSRSALVNLGGSIGVLGAPPDRSAGWPVGIAHPRRPGEVWKALDLDEGHLATSGDYERWVETPSGRKHHLLDPASGEPTRGIASLTAWAGTGVDADLASTAAFVALARGDRPAGPAAGWLALRESGGGLAESRRRRVLRRRRLLTPAGGAKKEAAPAGGVGAGAAGSHPPDPPNGGPPGARPGTGPPAGKPVAGAGPPRALRAPRVEAGVRRRAAAAISRVWNDARASAVARPVHPRPNARRVPWADSANFNGLRGDGRTRVCSPVTGVSAVPPVRAPVRPRIPGRPGPATARAWAPPAGAWVRTRPAPDPARGSPRDGGG